MRCGWENGYRSDLPPLAREKTRVSEARPGAPGFVSPEFIFHFDLLLVLQIILMLRNLP